MSETKCYTFYVENKSSQYKKSIDIIGESIKNSYNDVLIRHINPKPFITLEDDLLFANYGYIEVGLTELIFFDTSYKGSEIYLFNNTNSDRKEVPFTTMGIDETPIMKSHSVFKLNSDICLMADLSPNCSFAIHIWLMSKYEPIK